MGTLEEIAHTRFGFPMTADEARQFILTAKAVAAVDGFSIDERAGLDRRLREIGVPDDVRVELLDADVSGFDLSGAVASFGGGTARSKALCYGVIRVCLADGISDQERTAIASLAADLGLPASAPVMLEQLANLEQVAMAARHAYING